MCKKILASLLAAVMVLGTVSFAVVDGGGTEVVYEVYDFANNPNGAVAGSGPSNAHSEVSGFYGMYSTRGEIVNSSGESYIHYHRTGDSSTGSRLMKEFNNTFKKTTESDKVRLSFNARATVGSEKSEIMFGKLKSDKTNIENGILIKMSQNNLITDGYNNGFVFSNASTKAIYSSFNDGNWHNYEFIFDFGKENTGLNKTTGGTLYFNFDGKNVKNDGGRTAFLLDENFEINGILFADRTLGNGWDIDDIQISTSLETTPKAVEMQNDNGTVILAAENSTEIKYVFAQTADDALAAFEESASVYSEALSFTTGTYYLAAKAYNGELGGPMKIYRVKVRYSGIEIYDFSAETNKAELSNVEATNISRGINSGFLTINTGSNLARIYNDAQEAYIDIYNGNNSATATNRVGKTFAKEYGSGSKLSFWINTSDSALKKIRLQGTGLDVWAEITPDSFVVGDMSPVTGLEYNDGKWHEIAFEFIFAESKIMAYFDGEYIGRATVPASATFKAFQIGSAAGGSLLLDDVQISDRIDGIPEVVKVKNDYGNITLSGGKGDDVVIRYYAAPSLAEAQTGFKDNAEVYTGEFTIESGAYIAVQAYNDKPDMNIESTFKVWGPFETNRIVIDSVESSELETVTVPYGTAFSKLGLPGTVTGYYGGENMNEIQIPIIWQSTGYDRKTAGEQTIHGVLSIPAGFEFAESEVSISVIVEADTVKEEIAENISVRKNVGADSPLSTGGVSQTDTLQLGYKQGIISITGEGIENAENIADSMAVDNAGKSIEIADDGNIDICFTDFYDGERTLKDIKLMFANYNETAKYDLELLYKKAENGEWIRFFSDAVDFATLNDGASTSYGENFKFSKNVFPALMLSGFENQVSDVYALRIKISGSEFGTVLCEADINMQNDGEKIAAARREINNPLKFAKAYGSGSVIQRDTPVKVWGYGGDNGDEIKVEIINAENAIVETQTAVSDGRIWSATLGAMSGGHSVYSIRATDLSDTENTAEITDILFGDVFIASGQSNMEMTLSNTVNQLKKLNASEADRIVNEANGGNTEIRFFNQSNVLSSMVPLEDAYTGSWTVGGSYENIQGYSAVAYFFAQKLYSELGGEIPIGVIAARRGGTKIKAWIPEKAYTSAYNDLTDYNRSNYLSYRVWTGEWNAQLAPLTCLNAKGVIWYQGEDDTDIPESYKDYFRVLKDGWREEFNNEQLSFNIVQLSAFGAKTGKYPAMRQTQLQLWQKYENDNVNMITTIDVGNETDIHPIYKAPVGNRLAGTVAANVYGKNIEYSGPLFEKLTAGDNKVILSFTHADGLKAQQRSEEYTENFTPSSSVNCLEVLTEGSTDWVGASGEIVGNTIEIRGENIVGVRYAWADYPVNPNLYNSSNLPASPFMATLNEINAAPSVVLSGNKAEIKLSYNSTDRLNLSAKLIIAKYNSMNVLVGSEIKDIKAVLNEKTDFGYSVDLNGAENVSAMLVEDLNTLKPLTRKGTN